VETLQSINARTGEARGVPWPASTVEDVAQAVQGAVLAFERWSGSSATDRARLLRALGQALGSNRAKLVAWADLETALGAMRLASEVDRCVYLWERMAQRVEHGAAFVHLDDPAQALPPPMGQPALWRLRVPLGPVGVFAANPFPFLLSVLGSDTASALAAGCSVVVKAHPGHPGLSRQYFEIVRQVLLEVGAPPGLIGAVQGADPALGVALVSHPALAACTFTGSRAAGQTLWSLAQARPHPIPFYGGMSAVNPVVALPAVLHQRGLELASTLANSLALGCGQYGTNPGVIVLIDSPSTDEFMPVLLRALGQLRPHAMLSKVTRSAFEAGVRQLMDHGALSLLQQPATPEGPGVQLLQVSAQRFIEREALREEVFGPVGLVVRAADLAEVERVLAAVGGSLTVTLWGVDDDTPEHRALVRAATAVAGRVLFEGVPTTMSIAAGQHHGGPWPASTDPMHSALGDAAIDRFLRPVCWQDPPPWLRARNGQPL